MNNYKKWILFMLLSIASFANKGVGVEIVDIGIDSVDPITFKLIIESTTVSKFESPEGSIKNIIIKSGLHEDYPSDAELVYVGEVEESPKIITTFIALIQTDIQNLLSDQKIEIEGKIDIENASGSSNALKNKSITYGPASIGLIEAIDIEIFEKLGNTTNWMNNSTNIMGSEIIENGYIFTKGGSESLEGNPAVYVTGSTGKGITQIKELKIQKNYNGIETIVLSINEETPILEKISGFESNGKNTIKVTPISVLGVEGTETILDFVIDTEINDWKLGDGIIGKLNSGGKIIINISDIQELSGIDRYSYTMKVGDKTKVDNEINLNGDSFTSLTENSITSTPKWIDGKIEISTLGFVAGSKGTLLFTVYDKLGHKKTFEKVYFIPTESLGVKATIEEEVRQKKSSLKIIGDGTTNKFELESSIDKSKE